MNIRPKIILVVLPLIIAPLVLAALVSYLSARNGITAVASDFLRFKSKTLVDYMDGQWNLLVSNGLDEDPEYLNAAQDAMSVFAASLVRSSDELIFAVDSTGEFVMSSGPKPADSFALSNVAEEITQQGLWIGNLDLAGERRVAFADYFPPWGWTVFVTDAWVGFYSSTTRIAILIAIIAAASVSVSLIFLIAMTGVLTKPLVGMVGAIEGIIETMDLSTRVPVLYEDETGRLAHAFNLMTENLDKANEDIKSFALRAVFAHRQAVLAQKETEESREREQNLRVLFQKYVPQSVIDKNITRAGQDLRVGEHQFVSVLMSDIRSFTTISEKMTPEELVDSLNRYFEVMVDVIDDRGGITDKYIGDAIMALFGAPEKKEDDVARSVFAAIDMMNALDGFNAEQEKRGSRPFRIGIGVHYGVVTAGNIGSDKKMDYTVIGETVNMASRLEGLTKFYGTPIIISQTVARRIKDQLATRLLDRVMVKGSSVAMPIYTVSRKLTMEKEDVWDAFAKGQERYYDRDFPGARKAFQDALKAYPDDKPSQIFLERTLEYLNKPPADDWTGAYQHDTK